MRRLLNLLLLITFQFCYLEWPPNNSLFIYQGEFEIIKKTDNLLNNLFASGNISWFNSSNNSFDWVFLSKIKQ
jgi:hypothetical protein